MKIKRVEFANPVSAPESRSYRRPVSALVAGDGIEIEVDKGMVILSREGCESVHVPMTNIRCFIAEMPSTKKGKEDK